MIRKTVFISMLSAFMLFSGGCAKYRQPWSLAEKTSPGKADRPLAGLPAGPMKAVPETEEEISRDAVQAEEGKSPVIEGYVTGRQIEKTLFPEPVTRIQRPVELAQEQKAAFKAKKGDIVFNFNDAGLREVIETFAEILGMDYILEAAVDGTVTIHTAGGLHPEQVWPVFFQILEANGLTAVKQDGIFRIVEMKSGSRHSLKISTGEDLSDISPGERSIMQIISLDHIDVTEMVKLITPVLSEGAAIIAHEESNTMLLIDRGIFVLKALNLVRVFDIDTFQQKNHHFYLIRNMDVDEAARLLNEFLKAYGKPESKFSLIPIKRLNMIIGISSDPVILKSISSLLEKVDLPEYNINPKIYVYKVQNGSCADMATLLSEIFTRIQTPSLHENREKSADSPRTDPSAGSVRSEGRSMGSITVSGLPGTAVPNDPTPAKPEPLSQSVPGSIRATGDSGSETLKGEIRITADEARNALIIEAIPSDYHLVKTILNQLDIMPRQVLIEVTIADIELTDSLSLGIEWEKLASGAVKASPYGTIGQGGINFNIGLSQDWKMMLSALASEDRINILSTPLILASDNKKATINVADDIPVVDTVYRTVTDNQNVIEHRVQYRKTGIILMVTPNINDKGFVTMETALEVSNVGDGVEAGGQTYPSFKSRNINTVFTVNHRQTIMIGGLIRQNNTRGDKGVPFLSSIPGLGWLFGKQTDSLQKTELTIFITPHVIYSMDDVEEISRDFQSKSLQFSRGE